MTEAQLQAAVIELARLLGYRVAHFRAAQTVNGWRTPVEADGKGFPDLVLAKPGRLLFVELKGDRGQESAEQAEWLTAIALAGGDAYLWRPRSWLSGEVEEILRG